MAKRKIIPAGGEAYAVKDILNPPDDILADPTEQDTIEIGDLEYAIKNIYGAKMRAKIQEVLASVYANLVAAVAPIQTLSEKHDIEIALLSHEQKDNRLEFHLRFDLPLLNEKFRGAAIREHLQKVAEMEK